MKRLFFLFASLCSIFLLQNYSLPAQDGGPFFTNYSITDETLAENYSMCVNKEGVLVMANRKGLLVFDAEEWKVVKTPELPVVVASQQGFVFVGGRNFAGYLVRNSKGAMDFVDLSLRNAGVVFQIAFDKDNIYFISPTAITSVNVQDLKQVGQVKAEKNDRFQYGFVLNNKLLVDMERKGLMLLFNSKELRTWQDKFSLSGRIICHANYDSISVILGTSENKLFVYDGKTSKPLVLQDQQYVSEGVLTDIKLLNSNYVAVATNHAGCLVFDKKTGNTKYTLNYSTGLPDDEILAFNTDNGEGLWLAHYYGLTRVDAGIPVKNFSYFKGLEGKPQSIEFFNNKLFVGTSNGVYFLDQKKDYVEFIAKVQAEPVEEITPVVVEKKEEPIQAKKEEPKRGFFSKIFKKKSETDDVKENKSIEKEDVPSGFLSFFGKENQNRTKASDVKKTYKLASTKYVYNKVPGFDFKCKQLYVVGKRLVALSSTGLFEITEKSAKSVFNNLSIYYLYYVKDEKILYICCEDGVYEATVDVSGNWKIQAFQSEIIKEPIYSMAKDVFENYWFGSEGKVLRIKLKAAKKVKEKREYVFNTEFHERVIVRLADKKPVFFLSSGIYSIFNDSIQSNRMLAKFAGAETKLYFLHSDYTWVQHKNNWILLKAQEEPDTITAQYLNLFSNPGSVNFDQAMNLWVIEDNSSVYKIDQQAMSSYKTGFNAFVKKFTGASGEMLDLSNITLDSRNNYLKILVSAPYFLKPGSNQYQIYVDGLSKGWENWTSNPEFSLLLPSGKWTVRVRAKNVFGNVSEEKELNFAIKKPFYSTWWFMLICVVTIAWLILLFIKYRERSLRHEKEVLENKVRERTRQIEEQKEEIEAQRDDLMTKNVEIEKQRSKIELQNHEITDSIRYAKRLQAAVMPDGSVLEGSLKEFFILFKPKDIVSGDFFWAKRIENRIIIAAADCTGHGVPGAFLSMLGMSVLNEISLINDELKAHEILNMLRRKIKASLIKEGSDDQAKDGMDISLIIVDLTAKKVQYAGANNSIYLIRDNEIIEFSADKMPIGIYIGEKDSFSLKEFDLQANDSIYMFSDGYRDQIGGIADKRLKTSGFKDLLLRVQGNAMTAQKEKLEHFFEEWRGKNEQLDDILVMGVKV